MVLLSGLLLFRRDPFVFSLCGKAAADVPLGLVALQQAPHLGVEGPVHGGQPLGEVLVDRRFADAEAGGRRADGAVVFNDIGGQVAGALLDAAADGNHSPCAAMAARFSAPYI